MTAGVAHWLRDCAINQDVPTSFNPICAMDSSGVLAFQMELKYHITFMAAMVGETPDWQAHFCPFCSVLVITTTDEMATPLPVLFFGLTLCAIASDI